MDQAVGCHETVVPPEAPPHREIQRPPLEIRHSSTCLFDQQRAGSLIPDGVRNARRYRKSEQQVGVAASQHDVLGLAVHQDRRRRGAQDRERAIESRDITMCRFERPEHTRVSRVIDT